MFKSTISKEEIKDLELKQYEGSIQLIDMADQLQAAFRSIKKEKYVGFDTETKPVFVKGAYNQVSLVQIAIPGTVFLFRTNSIGLPGQLRAILSDENTGKIGVALADDVKELRKLKEFKPAGFIELSQIVKALGIESNGLRNLTATILGFRVSKSAQVSNWEAPVLSEKQLRYAATDAWACLEMYRKLRIMNLI